MMYDAIKNFAGQFAFEPVITNDDKIKQHSWFVVVGMGGSALAADLLADWDSSLEVLVHKDYGLPALRKETLKKYLIILSSYSGNTEETVQGLAECIKRDLDCAVISVNGKLLSEAIQHKVPYVRLPDTGIQPRSALGYSTLALAKIMGLDKARDELKKLAKLLKPAELESVGKQLAKQLNGSVPIIYSSTKNKSIAYNWKIKLNETGKVPAFYNVVPELNHNEMTGFDVAASTAALSNHFTFLFLQDSEDRPKINQRFKVLAKLYRDRHLKVIELSLSGKGRFERIFKSLIIADWTAYYTAEGYDVEAEQVPMVEEFKKLIR